MKVENYNTSNQGMRSGPTNWYKTQSDSILQGLLTSTVFPTEYSVSSACHALCERLNILMAEFLDFLKGIFLQELMMYNTCMESKDPVLYIDSTHFCWRSVVFAPMPGESVNPSFNHPTKIMVNTAKACTSKFASCDRTRASISLDVAVCMCDGEDFDLDKSFHLSFFVNYYSNSGTPPDNGDAFITSPAWHWTG